MANSYDATSQTSSSTKTRKISFSSEMYTNSNLNDYFRSYCWIHGTAYIREHLQGKATGCFVDQSRIESEEDAPVRLM